MNQIDEKKSVKRKKIPSSLWLNKPKRRRSCETLLISGDKSTPALEKKNTVVPGISTLNAAPKKIRKCVKPQKSRKKLFEELSCTGEVLSLMPTVLKNVQKAGHLADFINLLKLISVDKFPLNNISFLLMLEVARWYSLENTTKMFYSDQYKTVNNYESCTIDIPKQIQPGLIEQAIQMKPKTDTYVLSVDGKKLAPGLTKDNGDIDLFGYGMEDSIQKLRLRLKTEKDVVTSTRDDWSTMSPAEKCQKLQDIDLIISYRIKDLRLLFMKQKLALSKFHKEAGDDWRSSRFVYVTQVLSDMAAMDVKELMYLCWTEESSTVFRAKFDADLWKLVTDEIKDVYLCQTPKRPTRLSERSKLISEKIEVYRKTMVTFLCEIPSVKATSREISQTHVNCPYVFPVTKGSVDQSTENIELTLCNVNRVIDETYEICRRKATEVLVWLLSDTNRCWNIEIPHFLPVAYAMKGYSLTTQTMRTMNEHYFGGMQCTRNWHSTRDVDERPLTLLQLQRDVYETASKEKRNTILKHLSEKPIADDLENDVCAIRNESGGLNVTSELLRKVFQAIHYTTKSQNVTKRDLESKQDKVQSDGSLSCLPDEALEVLIESENFNFV
ncbi:unnamed protein product [Mytilus coruscus]|uniref:Uncharacterized protein n=1 Tax=Mytilus coruscus TaxID=42192 RepID=A0A6J8D5T4_MYTCO|nr:unnamed protein product [Mytilus coruscus]